MSLIKEQIKELRQYASERKGEIADICNRAADTIEGLSEKFHTPRYSDAEIQRMQELEQAEIEKAYELGRMEQEACEDDYIKVPKKALKYRTAGMVAYNAEWLKDHFDIERAVICGAQQPCDDAISRQAVLAAMRNNHRSGGRDIDGDYIEGDYRECLYDDILYLPSVTPQPKTGKWIINGIGYSETYSYKLNCSCSVCGYEAVFYDPISSNEPCLENANYVHKFCPNCGFRMIEPRERSDKEWQEKKQ